MEYLSGTSQHPVKEKSMKTMVVNDEKDVELRFRQYFRKEILQKKIEFIFAFSCEDTLQQLYAMSQT